MNELLNEKSCILKKNNGPGETGIEKGVAHIIVAILQYLSNAVLSKTILKKTTGNIRYFIPPFAACIWPDAG